MTGDSGFPREPATQRAPAVTLREESMPVTASTEKTLAAKPLPHVTDRANLTVVAGLDAGRVIPIDRDEVVLGRGADAHGSLDDAGVSRRHARIVRVRDDEIVVEDLDSTNGTFVRGSRTRGPVALVSGDRIQLGPNVVLRFSLTDELEESMHARLFESSVSDALTGVYNRRHFDERLASELAFARRHGTAVAVLLIDVDHFKHVNDTHGHLVGDRVLRAVAQALAQHVRREEMLARYGGEEFAVLARSASQFDAERLGGRLRASVEVLRVPADDGEVLVTVSVGVACLAETSQAKEEDLVRAADRRLYRAKEQGRNRVCAAD